jgi:hypothetical protein
VGEDFEGWSGVRWCTGNGRAVPVASGACPCTVGRHNRSSSAVGTGGTRCGQGSEEER